MQTSNPYEYLQGHVLERGETSTYVEIIRAVVTIRYAFRKFGCFLQIAGTNESMFYRANAAFLASQA